MKNIVENIKLEPRTLFTSAKLEYYSGCKDDSGYTDAFKVTNLEKKLPLNVQKSWQLLSSLLIANYLLKSREIIAVSCKSERLQNQHTAFYRSLYIQRYLTIKLKKI